MVGIFENELGILFKQQDCHFLVFQGLDDLENLAYKHRRKAQTRLIYQQQSEPAHQGMHNRQHLMFAAC